jgi:hypothetical protein
MNVTLRTNDIHLGRVMQAKEAIGQYSLNRGFKSWLKYVKNETYKTYIDNLNR